MFPLCKGYEIFERVFPITAHETTIMIEELFGHESPNDEELLAVWVILKTRQQWRAAKYQ